jgi:hypothetical protein
MEFRLYVDDEVWKRARSTDAFTSNEEPLRWLLVTALYRVTVSPREALWTTGKVRVEESKG